MGHLEEEGEDRASSAVMVQRRQLSFNKSKDTVAFVRFLRFPCFPSFSIFALRRERANNRGVSLLFKHRLAFHSASYKTESTEHHGKRRRQLAVVRRKIVNERCSVARLLFVFVWWRLVAREGTVAAIMLLRISCASSFSNVMTGLNVQHMLHKRGR